MIREVRRTQNSKQDKIQVVKSQPSVNSLREGQEVIYIAKSNRLERYRKEKGRLWVSYMDTDNNYAVNKNLSIGGNLNVKGGITGNYYVMFCHNFSDDIGTTEHYLPWGDINEQTHPTTTTGGVTGFLTPYDMTLKKILFRLDDINAQADITFKVERVDNDNTADEIASAEFDDPIVVDTLHELNRSDFNVNPKVVANSMAALSITADADFNLSGVSKAIFITSVWEVEILI
tara:strand:+ start:74 stop:769 length:696 start_codon:yes stop_codon:yes gene_type:complete